MASYPEQQESADETGVSGGMRINTQVASYVGAALFYFGFKALHLLDKPHSLGQAFLYGAIPAVVGAGVFQLVARLINRRR